MPRIIDTLITHLFEAIGHQKHSDTTQITGTTGSYVKAAMILKSLIPEDGRVLDYGSGLGEGALAMRNVFPPTVTIETYEPSPSRSKYTPTYASSDEIHGPYDAIVCLNVLNVLQPELRDQVVKHIARLLSPNGHAIISTRTWSGDVNAIKNVEQGEESRSVWVIKKTKDGVRKIYQKGFDGNELEEYVRSEVPNDVRVRKLAGRYALSGNAIFISKGHDHATIDTEAAPKKTVTKQIPVTPKTPSSEKKKSTPQNNKK